MLLRQDFRRCHEGSLPVIGSAEKKRKKSKNCLSGSNISLEKAAHHIFAGQIPFDLFPGPLLGSCKGIWKFRKKFLGKSL